MLYQLGAAGVSIHVLEKNSVLGATLEQGSPLCLGALGAVYLWVYIIYSVIYLFVIFFVKRIKPFKFKLVNYIVFFQSKKNGLL